MAFFYATSEDLLPVLSAIEAKLKIKYTLMGHLSDTNARNFSAARELPSLALPAPYDSAIACPRYLVTLRDAGISPRKISRDDGTSVWAIDQLQNEESVVFSHGGRFGDDVLLYGEVRTASRHAVAQKLQRAFDNAIRKSFARIQAFRVGREAEALLDAGIRLTGSKQSPRLYDLAREHQAAHRPIDDA